MSDDAAPEPLRVFLSYSHESASHAARVLALADRLRRDGIDAWLDQYEPAPSQGWERWMVDEIERADRVLAICTATYRRRFEGKETKGGQGVDWEGAILTGKLYERQHELVLPVVLDKEDLEHRPTILRTRPYWVVDGETGYWRLYRALTGQPETPAPELGPRKALPPQPRRSPFGSPSARPQSPEPAAVEEYRVWADARYGHLDLVGMGAGDLRIGLDQIYVPLRVVERPARGHDLDAGKKAREETLAGWDQNVELDRLFLRPGAEPAQHALIFGEPGSGKTTALKKLHQLTLESPEALGLAAETLPVFLRLRRFAPELLEKELPAYLEAELAELSGSRLTAGLGAELWQRRRLLLLCDGLDEIADEDHRARVLERLAWQLSDAGLGDVRMVVSCRYSGWTPAVRGTKLETFARLDVRPFDDEQIARLVELWFREVERRGYLEPALAEDRARGLIRALTDPEHRRQDFLTLVSTPLLLTLLCLVVMRGGEIPRRRVDFYEECLRILLREWRARQARLEPPVGADRALELLGELAWYLHSNHRRDDLTYPEIRRRFRRRLDGSDKVRAVFRWLLDDVALLERYTERHYGFAHLGLQEHLAARHLAGQPDLLDRVCEEWDDSWWEEVMQLLAGLPGGKGFAPLVRRLLATDVPLRRADLLAACLREASDPDLEPFYEVLRAESDDGRRAAVLSLLRGRDEPALLELARDLANAGSEAVRSIARQVLERASRPRAVGRADVFLIHGPADGRPAARLTEILERRALVVDRPAAGERWDHDATYERMQGSRWALILIGAGADELAEIEPEDFEDVEAVVVSLPGDPRPRVPVSLAGLPCVELAELTEDAVGAELMGRLLPYASAAVPVDAPFQVVVEPGAGEGEAFTEPLSGEVLLPVPAGRFQMGGTAHDREQPIHWVRLSAFWLAKTPVTNRQYRQFIEATGREEPLLWRDRRLSKPEQPVVGVSWHDAVAYCDWLTDQSPSDWRFELPTEAQWEYASRGTDGRKYPWGNEAPKAGRACFDQDLGSGQPAEVGSYPAGEGPFGHLDLAGNVWEWCRDLWEPNYKRWVAEEPLDPIGEADADRRPLRGGAWWFVAAYLRSTSRSRYEPGYRHDFIGFRVSCAPSSLKS